MKNKPSIPVIGVPIVNGTRWLEKLILSIDYPVDNLFIINNSGSEKIKIQLEELRYESFLNENIKKLHITHLPSNLGVPAAWNLIIKSFLMEPYWIISNHDVSFTPGLLEEIATIAQDKDVSLIHPRAGEFYTGTYDLFAITEIGIKIIGLFDENLYPAYGEDSDFIMRIKNLDPKTIKGLKNKYFHGNEIATEGDESYYKNAQQTKKEDPQLIEKLEKVNFINYEYLNKKWGEDWRVVNPYKKPFNNNDRFY